MSFFGALIRTTVNVALLPLAVLKDAVTMGGTLTNQNPNYRTDGTYLADQIEKIKEEADD